MEVRVDPPAFMELGRQIMGFPRPVRRETELKRFRAHFGTTDIRCTIIWRMLRANADSVQVIGRGPRPQHLLWALLWLKTYDTESILCGKVGCDETTYRKWIWRFVEAIAIVLPSVIKLSRRLLNGGQGHTHLMSVDGTDCQINQPTQFWRGWYSHKFKKAGLRYEVAVALRRSEIVWINGPFPCGRYPDITIYRNGLKNHLQNGERVMADKGYRGDPTCNVPNDTDPANLRRLKKRIGSRHESVNSRLKAFRCLDSKFRHDIDKHRLVFRAVAVVTQVNITQGDSLWDI